MANDEANLGPRSAGDIPHPIPPRRSVTPHPQKKRENTGFLLSRFHQEDGIRHYTFERADDGGTSTEFTVDADVRLLRKYGIALQELPLLCRHLLEQQEVGAPERAVTFTEQLMKEQADRRAALKQAAEEKKKVYHGRRPARPAQDLPWRV